MTDIVQVVLLIFGGLAVSYIALNTISDNSGVLSGLTIVYQELPEKFDMILSPDNPSYENLPGIWILLGAGVWICLLYTSPSPRDMRRSRMPSSA